MVFDNENLLKNIEELENIKELEHFKETEEEKEEREKKEREEYKQNNRRDLIEFIVYITLSLILLYCIFELTKNNKNGILVGGGNIFAPFVAAIGKAASVVGKAASVVGKGAVKVGKVVGKVGKVIYKGAKVVGKNLYKGTKVVGKTLYTGAKFGAKTLGSLSGSSFSDSRGFNFSSSFKSSNYEGDSYSNSIGNIKNNGASKILLTLVIGGFICLFAFIIPTLLPLFLLFVALLICKTFAEDQYNEMIK